MTFKVPLTFIRSRAHLTWREVEFGLQNGWLTDEAAIELAIDRVMAGDDSPGVLELASVLPGEKYKVTEIIRGLAERDRECSNGKWLFLLLAWLYENRDAVHDALGVVEEFYADFDYPEEIASFVKYMPPEDPLRVGESYLMDAWRQYLETAGQKYGEAVTGST
jgi:hypothetical protein